MSTSTSQFRCYAAANTYEGFLSFYDEILSDLDYCYIIKGGPGTGKSVFMKKISAAALEKGYTVTEIHCSSDPDSLDGLKINELHLGFTDGTAPHVRDPKYPKIKDEIIDLAQYIDKKILKRSEDDILRLTDEKTVLFKRLYTYLASFEYLLISEREIHEPYIDKEKMSRAIDRILDRYPNGKAFSAKKVQISAYSMNGTIKFDTYSALSDTVFNVGGKRDVSYAFMAMLFEKTKERGYESYFSCRPTSPYEISDLYLPEAKISFISNADFFDKNINLERFFIKGKEDERISQKFIKTCKKILGDGADKIFKEIADKHFELERIYASAMDFSRSDSLCEKLISEIL